MLKREVSFYQWGAVSVMSDVAILAASAKVTLLEVVKQTNALATGLLNAAPGNKTGAPNETVLYLQSISEVLAKIAEECDKLLPPSEGHVS